MLTLLECCAKSATMTLSLTVRLEILATLGYHVSFLQSLDANHAA
jgi:hypothetical protein